MTDQPPTLRPPTPLEQAAYRRDGQWPDSYVQARLAHYDQVAEWVGTRDLREVLTAFWPAKEAR